MIMNYALDRRMDWINSRKEAFMRRKEKNNAKN
jgi:hypothetical protein